MTREIEIILNCPGKVEGRLPERTILACREHVEDMRATQIQDGVARRTRGGHTHQQAACNMLQGGIRGNRPASCYGGRRYEPMSESLRRTRRITAAHPPARRAGGARRWAADAKQNQTHLDRGRPRRPTDHGEQPASGLAHPPEAALEKQGDAITLTLAVIESFEGKPAARRGIMPGRYGYRRCSDRRCGWPAASARPAHKYSVGWRHL